MRSRNLGYSRPRRRQVDLRQRACHGGGGDADALAALTRSLEADYSIASYDRRGYVRSPPAR